MATNEFVPFAASTGANVVTQGEYVGSEWQQNGFSMGVAKSAEANKVWRQATTIGAAWGAVVNNVLGWDLWDNGDVSGIAGAFQQVIQAIASGATSDLLQRMANAEANIANLWGEANNQWSWRQWADPTINTLWARMGNAEANINNILNWINTYQPQIDYLWNWKFNGFDPAWADLMNNTIPSLWNSIGVLNQQQAQMQGQINSTPSVGGGSSPTNGWIIFPSGIIFQWRSDDFHDTSAAESSRWTAFPRSFPNSCWQVQVSTGFASGQYNQMMMYQVGPSGWNNASVNINRARSGSNDPMNTWPIIFAIGN